MARYVFQKKDQIAGGRIQGVRNRDAKLGFFAQTPDSVEARLAYARSPEHRERVRLLGKKFGPDADMDKVRTIAGCKKGAAVGGPIGRHVRWHVNRRVFNLACKFCLEAIARKENWGIEVFEPEN
jgi:hypothetical protein